MLSVSRTAAAVIVAVCVALLPAVAVAAPDDSPRQVLVQRTVARADTTAGSLTARQVVDVPAGTDAVTFAAQIARDPGVEFAQPDWPLTIATNDPLFTQQWGLPHVELPAVWADANGSDIVIAIIDTGVDLTHPEFNGKLVTGTDIYAGDEDPADEHGHGTAVASVAAAVTDNATGMAGACPACRIMPVRVLGPDGSGSTSAVSEGIRWAVNNGADIINLSLGAPGENLWLDAAVGYARDNGVIVIGAAGNDGTYERFYPAASDGAISVAGTTRNDEVYEWSNRGDWVDVAAPGCAIAITAEVGYATQCGTSIATPVVSGAAAVLLSAGIPKATVETALQSTGVTVDEVGGPRINVRDALNTASVNEPPHAPTAVTAAAMNEAVRVTWDHPADGGPVDHYIATASPGGMNRTVTADVTDTVIGGLQNGQRYTVTVSAYNDHGHAISQQSDPVTPAQAPVAPTGVTAVAGNASATVSWEPSDSVGHALVTGYEVTSYPDEIVETVGASDTQTVMTGLVNGRSYTFVVAALSMSGQSDPSVPSDPVVPLTRPTPPPTVTGRAGDRQITVTWDVSDHGPAEGYEVDITDGTTTSRVVVPALTDVDRQAAVMNDLDNGTSWTVSVTARNSKGTSAPAVADRTVRTRPDPPGIGTDRRIVQPDPVLTAVQLSASSFADGDATTVVVGRDDVFADSLAGAALAGDGPVLFTPPGQPLREDVAAEIRRVTGGPTGCDSDQRIYLLGGESAISEAVATQLTGEGFCTERLSGPSRVETAIRIAEVVTARTGRDDQLMLTRADTWADAVTAGAFGAAAGVPIVVTYSDGVHPAVLTYLADRRPDTTYVIGGYGAISADVDTVISRYSTPVRVAGKTRTETAGAVATGLWGRVPVAQGSTGGLVLINGYGADGWAKALAAAPLSAREHAPQLYTMADGTLDAATTDTFTSLTYGFVVAVGSDVTDGAISTARSYSRR